VARLEVVVNSPLAFSRRFADALDERELGDAFSRAPVGIEDETTLTAVFQRGSCRS
jgi:hypothetical protein